MYLRESLVWKGKVRALVWVDYIQNLFDGLTRGLYNFCETASLITSYSTSGVKSIDLTVLGSHLVQMESKAKSNMGYIGIYTTLLKPQENLLNLDWISSYGR